MIATLVLGSTLTSSAAWQVTVGSATCNYDVSCGKSYVSAYTNLQKTGYVRTTANTKTNKSGYPFNASDSAMASIYETFSGGEEVSSVDATFTATFGGYSFSDSKHANA